MVSIERKQESNKSLEYLDGAMNRVGVEAVEEGGDAAEDGEKDGSEGDKGIEALHGGMHLFEEARRQRSLKRLIINICLFLKTIKYHIPFF